MEKIVKKFLNIVNSSDLPEEKKELWRKFSEISSLRNIQLIFSALKEDADMLHFFTNDLISKLTALRSGKIELMEKIQEEENVYLNLKLKKYE